VSDIEYLRDGIGLSSASLPHCRRTRTCCRSAASLLASLTTRSPIARQVAGSIPAARPGRCPIRVRSRVRFLSLDSSTCGRSNRPPRRRPWSSWGRGGPHLS